MAKHLQVVHPLIRQVNVTARMVIVDIREPHLQTMGVGKETALRVTVRHTHIGMEVIACITQHHTAVAFTTCRIAQALVFQFDPIGVVLYTIRGHLIVGIIYQRGVGTIEPAPQTATDLRRKSQLLIVRASEQLHATAKPFRRHVVGVEAEHATDGVTAIEQSPRPLDHLRTVDGELVDL